MRKNAVLPILPGEVIYLPDFQALKIGLSDTGL